MLRRSFVRLLAGSGLAAWLGLVSRTALSAQSLQFLHGVASGDPLQDRVILWTRVSGAQASAIVVHWQVASDPEFERVLRSGEVVTDAAYDYTIKVDVDGLPAGSRLYYRFDVDGVNSPVGSTRTLPAGDARAATFAVVCCSNYPAGYFHAYREIADQADLDAVIHLGDYIYEYGQGGYATEHAEELSRIPDPPSEAVTLDDYRRRHAQYKSDPDSQAMHAAHPLIAVWDDHEVANNAWHDGAQNHDDDEGSWGTRRDAAITAYMEWMPIRSEPDGARTRIFREFRYGTLLSLIMLDTRLFGRDRQPRLEGDMSGEDVRAVIGDPDREMLGAAQTEWLQDTLHSARDTTWQVLGQQVMMSTVRAPDLEPLVDRDKPAGISQESLDYNIRMSKRNPPLLLDTWDGYAAARERLLATLESQGRNPVILSGDLHTSIAGNLIRRNGDRPVAVEFMTPSVTSPGFAEYLPEVHPGAVRDATIALNPDLVYMETDRRGWLRMSFTPVGCSGEWRLLDSVQSKDFRSTVDKRLAVSADEIVAGLREEPI